MLVILPAREIDADAIWRIFHAVVSTGDTYAFDPDISREEALALWMGPKAHTYVAREDGRIIGTYVLKANQPGLGSHVANAAFMVAPECRARGVGRAMAEHCLAQARRLGFRAMQFNLVVSTNVHAVELWRQLGFQIVGQLPGAFNHRQLGFVDAYVMYRSLVDDAPNLLPASRRSSVGLLLESPGSSSPTDSSPTATEQKLPPPPRFLQSPSNSKRR